MRNGKIIRQTGLGDAAITTSVMGLGLAALGRPGYINLGHGDDLNNNYDEQKMEQHAHAILDQAWASGIRYFDAARSYGKAEKFLSSWLKSRNIKASDVTVGSKWGYTYTADWKIEAAVHEVKDHSLAVLERQWQESYNYLGEWLKLYQIHSATIESGVLQDTKVLNALARLKSDDIAIGLSLSGTKQAETLEKALAVEIDGKKLFDAVQATWNLLEMSAGLMLQQAHKQGTGIIIKEGLANGRLTQRNSEPDFKSKKDRLTKIAEQYNTTIDAFSLASILKQPWAHIVLSGASTIKQLQSNLQAVELKNIPDIDISEDSDTYWTRRTSLSWN